MEKEIRCLKCGKLLAIQSGELNSIYGECIGANADENKVSISIKCLRCKDVRKIIIS